MAVGAVTWNAAALLPPLAEAVMEALVFAATGRVVKVTWPLVAPAATVIVAGTVTEAVFEAIATEKPPVGAGLVRVTVPVGLAPPRTEALERVKSLTFGAVIARFAEAEAPLRVAVSFAEVSAATAVVPTVKVPVVAPAATVAVAGTVAEALSDARATVRPPAGAADEIVTVPVAPIPPTVVVLSSASAVTVGPLITRFAFAEVPLEAAVIFAVVFGPTAVVVIVKVPVVAPAARVAVAGTVAAALSEASATTSPPTGAGLEIVIVPVEVAPPSRVVGLRARPVTFGPVTVRFAVADEAEPVALMAAMVLTPTATVVMLNVAEVAPAGIVTVAGTTTAGLSDVSGIGIPPAAAGLAMVTVPTEAAPPRTEVGLRASVVTAGAFTARAALTVTVPVVAPMLAT